MKKIEKNKLSIGMDYFDNKGSDKTIFIALIVITIVGILIPLIIATGLSF
ncbi:MAG: hypothetical protein L3J34_04215 [Flavobacteriaceae bacterium]|nr:hypothetical protein [Flavobacteriaceae bacterium]